MSSDPKKNALKDLYRFAWWDPDKRQWGLAKNRFIAAGGSESEARETKNCAARLRPLLDTLFSDIIEGRLKEDGLKKRIKELRRDYPRYQAQIDRCLSKTNSTIQSKKEKEERRLNNQPFQILESHNTPIHELAPYREWFLLLDESGSQFNHRIDRSKPLFVGVLAPADSTEDILDLHGTNASINKLEKSFNRLLKRHDWSIFGLKLQDVPLVSGEQWIDGICEVIGWVLRLLPIKGETRLKVRVEQRAPHLAGSELSRLERLLLQSLVRVAPERAQDIQLDIKFIKKYKSLDIKNKRLSKKETHKWLAFADLVAYLWFSKKKDYRSWIEQSKLKNTFLHEGLTSFHRQMLDRLLSEHPLSGENWTRLLQDKNKTQSSVLQFILDSWKHKTAHSKAQWTLLINEIQKNLYSKSMHLSLLEQQVMWLEDVLEKSAYRLSLKEEFLFYKTQLARKNHNGELITIDEILQLEEKGKALVREDARIVCLTDLHLAVQCTHYFGFEIAERLMKKWEAEKTRTIGLNLKGCVFSTLGQQKAFLGHPGQAIELFDKAISLFEELSDPNERLAEQIHTRSYKVISMIDSPEATNQEIESELLRLSPDDDSFEDLCDHLISNADSKWKYIHHILLRYFYFRSPHERILQYIENPQLWKTESGHPWMWINMYRGLLLDEHHHPKAKDWIQTSLEDISFSGIMAAIGIVQLKIAQDKNVQWNGSDITQTLIQERLNAFAQDHTNADVFVQEFQKIDQDATQDPRLWIPKLLPFNFH